MTCSKCKDRGYLSDGQAASYCHYCRDIDAEVRRAAKSLRETFYKEKAVNYKPLDADAWERLEEQCEGPHGVVTVRASDLFYLMEQARRANRLMEVLSRETHFYRPEDDLPVRVLEALAAYLGK